MKNLKYMFCMEFNWKYILNFFMKFDILHSK